MFLGEFEHAIDDKGRLAVPARCRAALEDGLAIWGTASWGRLNAWQGDAQPDMPERDQVWSRSAWQQARGLAEELPRMVD